MKKAQVIGQVFIYIVTALIIGLVLLFGVQAIMKLTNTTNDVRVATFQKDFPDRLKADFDYGALDTKPITIPGDFSEICFIELGAGISCGKQSIIPPHPVIEDSWQSCVQQNIFLIGSSKMKSMYVGGLKVSVLASPTHKYLCEPIKAGIVTTLQFRGYGSGVTVEK